MAHKRKEMKILLATLLLNNEIPVFILSSKSIGGDKADKLTVIRPNNIIPTVFCREGGGCFTVFPHAVNIEVRVDRDQVVVLSHAG